MLKFEKNLPLYFEIAQLKFTYSEKATKFCEISIVDSTGTTYTGCPVNWYSLSISIPDFPDGPMKKS